VADQDSRVKQNLRRSDGLLGVALLAAPAILPTVVAPNIGYSRARSNRR
jgi:hypothetical protein